MPLYRLAASAASKCVRKSSDSRITLMRRVVFFLSSPPLTFRFSISFSNNPGNLQANTKAFTRRCC
jgi:hypothetical protein